jgi:hypothetical protein
MKTWSVVIEGRDFTSTAVMVVVIPLLFVLLATLTGKWTELPIQVGHVVCMYGAFVWPLLVMGRHRRRQDRILDKIRAMYLLAIGNLMAGEEVATRERLRTMRRLEAYWRYGASIPHRTALLSYIIVTNTALAFVGQVLWYHLASVMKPTSLLDTIELLWGTPWLLAMAGGFAIFLSFSACRDAAQIRSRPWVDFYGDRLGAALRAGRGVETAPQHDEPPLPEGVSVRELLGLRPGFTKAELRRAWLRLARELHPDRWTLAGQGVRGMKEAALKRVNAARDELIAEAM